MDQKPRSDSFKKFEWFGDDEANICMECKVLKFSVFNRKHHCRACGRVCCGECSKYSAPLETIRKFFPFLMTDLEKMKKKSEKEFLKAQKAIGVEFEEDLENVKVEIGDKIMLNIEDLTENVEEGRGRRSSSIVVPINQSQRICKTCFERIDKIENYEKMFEDEKEYEIDMDDDVEGISEILKENKALVSLDVSYYHPENNDFPFNVTIALGEMLKVNLGLETLELDGNDFGSKGMEVLMKALESNSSLKELSLNGCKIDYDGAKFVAKMLKVNKSITKLSLGVGNFGIHNHLGNEGIKVISDSLKENKTLKQIILFRCEFGTEGAVELSEMLKVNNTIELMDLGWNENIGNEGLFAICEGLIVNNSVNDLSFRNCNIDLEGILSISAMLQANDTIEYLNLSENTLLGEYKVFEELVKGLNMNDTVRSVDLLDCHIPSMIVPQIPEIYKNFLDRKCSLLEILQKTVYVKDSLRSSYFDEYRNENDNIKAMTNSFISVFNIFPKAFLKSDVEIIIGMSLNWDFHFLVALNEVIEDYVMQMNGQRRINVNPILGIGGYLKNQFKNIDGMFSLSKLSSNETFDPICKKGSKLMESKNPISYIVGVEVVNGRHVRLNDFDLTTDQMFRGKWKIVDWNAFNNKKKINNNNNYIDNKRSKLKVNWPILFEEFIRSFNEDPSHSMYTIYDVFSLPELCMKTRFTVFRVYEGFTLKEVLEIGCQKTEEKKDQLPQIDINESETMHNNNNRKTDVVPREFVVWFERHMKIALDIIHQNNLTHGRLTPENIIISRNKVILRDCRTAVCNYLQNNKNNNIYQDDDNDNEGNVDSKDKENKKKEDNEEDNKKIKPSLVRKKNKKSKKKSKKSSSEDSNNNNVIQIEENKTVTIGQKVVKKRDIVDEEENNNKTIINNSNNNDDDDDNDNDDDDNNNNNNNNNKDKDEESQSINSEEKTKTTEKNDVKNKKATKKSASSQILLEYDSKYSTEYMRKENKVRKEDDMEVFENILLRELKAVLSDDSVGDSSTETNVENWIASQIESKKDWKLHKPIEFTDRGFFMQVSDSSVYLLDEHENLKNV